MMTNESRLQHRYECGELKISIARRGLRGILSRNPNACCVNFNRVGLQCTSSRAFTNGEPVIVDLCLWEECIHELDAIICYCRPEEDHFICGVNFNFNSRRMTKETVGRTLMKIENNLRLLEKYPQIIQQV